MASLGLAVGLVNVRGQSSDAPPILLVVNSAAPNPFGLYLGEILRAEGIQSFTTAQLSTLDATVLASAPLVVLAETPLSAAQALLFSNFVAGGGRLIAMRPDAQIAPLFGLAPLGSSTTNGYLAINQSDPAGAGLEALTLPVRGIANHYLPDAGVNTVATLYSNRTTTTGFPAVTRFNRTAAWAFDLGRAVAYARQGDPVNINVSCSAPYFPPLRWWDMFCTGFDAQRIAVPYADIEMRLFARVLTDLLADTVPLPQLWYYPSARRALMLVTGDSHTYIQTPHDQLVANAESFGARVTLYLSHYLPYPTAAVAAQWRARGHELAMHPFGYQDGVDLQTGFQTILNYFTQAGWGAPSRTVRTHQIEWLGWVDAAQVAAGFGIGMDLTPYSYGPVTQQADGTFGTGYVAGSGRPMLFVTQAGVTLPIYGQTTVLIDHQLFDLYTPWSRALTTQGALAVSRGIIDQAVGEYHTVIPTQFHVDFYTFGDVQAWADGIMAHARDNNVPMWTAERWLNYTQARAATTITGVTWVAGANALQFTANVPAGAEPQTLMVPSTYNGGPLVAVQVNGAATAVTTQSINGRSMAMFSVGPTTGGAPVVVNYGVAVPSLRVNDVSVVEGTGGSNSALFAVSLSTTSTQTVTVNYATANGTAVAPGDYTAGSGTLTFQPGVTTQTVAVPIVTDAASEPNETFSLRLSNPTNATLADATGVATIVNDDAPPPALAVSDGSGPEGNAGSSLVTVTVALTAATTQTVTVNWQTADGTAVAGSDYTAASGTLTFAPGTTSQSLSLAVLGDLLDEPNETFTVVLNAPTNATIADGTGVVTILDDDPPPTLSVNDVSVTEGTGGTTTATFTVTLSAPSSQTVTVNYATADGTAVAPNDYTAAGGTLTIAPGTTTGNVLVSIVPDAVSEPSETFTLVLSSPTNATLGDAVGVGTINNDDSASGPATVTMQIASADNDVNENTAFDPSASSVWLGNANPSTASYAGLRFTGAALPPGATITSARLEVNAATTQWIGLAFEFGMEAAANSQPFTSTSRPSQRTLLAPRVAHLSDQQWVAGTWYTLDDLTPIVQALVNQPGWNAGNALALTLRGTGGSWARKFVTAFEGDPTRAPRLVVSYLPSGLPTLSVNDVSVAEGTGGTTTATFTVTLPSPSGNPVTFNYATSDGTATAPADYAATSGSRTIPPGATTTTISVSIVPDAISEPPETFNLTLSAPTNATFADALGVGTILDDDAGAGPVTLTLQVASADNDVNESTTFDPSASSVWLGNANPSTASYTGLRFTGAGLPPGATITSARLEVNSASTQWNGMAFEFGIEAAANSQPFTSTSRPSQRTLLAPRVAHLSDQQWVAGTWYTLDDLTPIVQALVNQSGWNAGNALALILRGTGGSWARKFVTAFEGDPTRAPRLVVIYRTP